MNFRTAMCLIRQKLQRRLLIYAA